MSREALHESLSALLDDETSELELRRILAAADDAELRSTWSRYQVARAVMHKELIVPQLDLGASVSAALAAEPAYAARPARSFWQGFGRVAVAASVTVAVLGGVRLYNQDQSDAMQLASQTTQALPGMPMTQAPVVLASYSPQAESRSAADPAPESGGSEWYQQHVPDYLRQHAQQATLGSPDAALPFARSASLEGR